MLQGQSKAIPTAHDQSAAHPAIRVLLIAPSLAFVGGQAVQADRLTRELRQDPSVALNFMPIAPVIGGRLGRLQSIRYVRTVVTFLYYLAMLLRTVPRYEILHVFCASYWSYTLWSVPPLILGKLLGRKVILNYRSGEAEDHLANWSSAVPTLRLADAIIAPSGYLVDVFAKFGLSVQTIYNVIDASKFRYRTRLKLRPVFLHNRSLEPLYNVACTFRAFHIVQQQYPDARLIVAHDGVCKPALLALQEELGLKNVQFVGKVPQSRIADLYDEADIYLTSPDLDCMPGSLLECYASGLPLIATKAGGIPYIVKHEQTGLLVDRNDHEAMANNAIRLLKEEELSALVTSQGRLELQKYTADAVRQEWIKLYRALAGR